MGKVTQGHANMTLQWVVCDFQLRNFSNVLLTLKRLIMTAPHVLSVGLFVSSV